MAVVFNEGDVRAEAIGVRARRQRLITEARMPGTGILLDRIAIEEGGSVAVTVPHDSVAWFHVLDGAADFDGPTKRQTLTSAHAAFLASGFRGQLASGHGAVVLYVEVPNAVRFDDPSGGRPSTKIVDWTREPLLDSKHDDRKRIYMATPKLFGSRAMKCEMIIYPPNTSGSKHRHEGAEHFKYVLQGEGTGYADESTHALRAGDVVYHPAGEWHYSFTRDHEKVTFIEFFVPGVFNTVWASERICSWEPTGRTIRGDQPVREIAAHAGNEGTPSDV